jgi:hypothetical protein
MSVKTPKRPTQKERKATVAKAKKTKNMQKKAYTLPFAFEVVAGLPPGLQLSLVKTLANQLGLKVFTQEELDQQRKYGPRPSSVEMELSAELAKRRQLGDAIAQQFGELKGLFK